MPDFPAGAFNPEVIERDHHPHAHQRVEGSFHRGRHGRLEDGRGRPGDRRVKISGEHKRPGPEGGAPNRRLGRRQLIDPSRNAPQECAEASHRWVRIRAGPRRQLIQAQPGFRRRLRQLRELAAGFIEAAAEALEVLLDELRDLGKKYRPNDAEPAVEQPLQSGKNSRKRPGPGHVGSPDSRRTPAPSKPSVLDKARREK